MLKVICLDELYCQMFFFNQLDLYNRFIINYSAKSNEHPKNAQRDKGSFSYKFI